MADLKMVYEKDAPLDALKGKTVAILGFGSQGHAHASCQMVIAAACQQHCLVRFCPNILRRRMHR